VLSPEVIPALIRFALFVGCVLLLGAGVFSRWVWTEAAPDVLERWLKLALLSGAVVVIASSITDVAYTANRVYAGLDFPTFWSYMTGSRHGTATMARGILALAVFGLGLGITKDTSRKANLGITARAEPGEGMTDRVLHIVLGIAVLATLSLTSHAGVDGWATFLFFSDLIHLSAMTAWVSAVAFLAFSPASGWKYLEPNIKALGRVSRIGLVAVIAMTATGVYASIVHVYALRALTGSSYGQSLLVKLGIVAVVIGVAAANRYRLLPELERHRTAPNLERFRRVMRFESLLLVGVLMASGYLGTQPPPEPGVTLRAEVAFSERTKNWIVDGVFKPTDGGTSLELRVKDASGQPPPSDFDLRGQLNMLDHAMQPIPFKITTTGPGSYRTEAAFWMSGHWQAMLRLPDGIVRVPLRAR
jgi:putative copper export protein